MGKDVDDLIGAAVRAHGEGQLEKAERLANEGLRLEPENAQAIAVLGIVAAKREDDDKAIHLLQRAIERDSTSADAYFWLSMLFRRKGRKAEALEMAKLASVSDVRNAYAHNQAGMCFLDMGMPECAVMSFRSACELGADVGPFFDNYGRACQQLGRIDEAIEAFRRVVKIGPPHPGPLLRLGNAYMSQSLMESAAECARQALKLNPQSPPANLLLARALIGTGAVNEGAKYALKTMKLAPGSAVPVAYYGWALQGLGQIEEASVQFRRSIEIEPRQGFAYYAWVQGKKITDEDRPMVEAMTRLSHDPSLPPQELLHLEFGLGKALENLGDFEAAMDHFDRGNFLDRDLKLGTPGFQKTDLLESVDFLISTFDRDFFEAHRSEGSSDTLPLFVVGMMRSGTTLAEQILSSHPEIGGAGELVFWPENAAYGKKLFTLGSGSPRLDSEKLQSLGNEYLKLLRNLAPGNARVVDKMNTNYLLLGLLHLAFPEARIIHMKRHPVDTCLSIWATPPAAGVNLCASKENLVFAYEQYRRLMEHWGRTLPADRLLEVQYESLVQDQETVTRRMVEFCGLDWNEACLEPEQNRRSVTTPSACQVRQPVYKTSVERWRKYEPWLGAFSALLPEASAR